MGTRLERFQDAAGLAVLIAVVPALCVAFVLHDDISAWHWENAVLHAVIESGSAMIALGLATMLLRSWQRRGRHLLWMSAALIVMAVANVGHAITTPGERSVWFRALATLIGGLLGALVWLPDRVTKKLRDARLVVGACALALALVALVSFSPSTALPRMIGADHFTPLAVSLNAIGGAGFVTAAFRFLSYRGNRSADPSLAIFAALCGAMGIVFGLSTVWDAAWWTWHVLQFFAAAAAFSGTVMMFGHTSRELEQEIERRVVAQKDVEYSKAELSAVLDSVGEGIISARPDGQIVMANREACAIWRTTAEHMLGMKVWELLPPEHRQGHRAAFQRYLETGVSKQLGRRVEGEGLRGDGSRFPLEIRTVETRIGDERLFTAAARDITDRVLAQQENERLHAEIVDKQRLAAIGETAAVFAHEVANPLNAMSLNLALLERRLGNDPKHRANLDCIESEVTRLGKLLGEFRLLAKREKIEVEAIDVGELVEAMLSSERERHERAKLTVELQIEAGLPVLRADATKLRQVLLNLLNNAADAMPSGGALGVEVARKDKELVIRVRDTGVGIPPGVDVFELFYTTKPQGTGLGLGIARRLAHLHGGSLTYESEPGRGTTFTLWLPLEQPRQAESVAAHTG